MFVLVNLTSRVPLVNLTSRVENFWQGDGDVTDSVIGTISSVVRASSN